MEAAVLPVRLRRFGSIVLDLPQSRRQLRRRRRLPGSRRIGSRGSSPTQRAHSPRLLLRCRQDYANFCLTACIIVAVVVVTAVGEPHIVPYRLWDARISYPVSRAVKPCMLSSP